MFKLPKIKQESLKYFLAAFALAFILTTVFLTLKLPKLKKPRLGFPRPKLSLPNKKTKKQFSFLTNNSGAYFDPLQLKNLIDQQDKSLLIVDLRSKKEFQKSHIKNAVNIPSYQKAEDVYGSLIDFKTIFNQFKKQAENKKLVVVYSYSFPNVLAQKISAFLINKGLPVKLLTISFQDWQMDFFRWMPEEALKKYNPDQYLAK